MEETVVYLVVEVNTCLSGPWNTRVLAIFSHEHDADHFVEILNDSKSKRTNEDAFFVEEWRVKQ